MTIETAIDALTTQTSTLLDVCSSINEDVSRKISDAVSASENAAIVPLVAMATNLIDTQSLLVTYISRG